jgi:hypothetical protein
MGIFFNKNAIRNKIQTYKMKLISGLHGLKGDEQSKRSQNKKADTASRDSFPASDPPGHISKSSEDKEFH